jgi:hypothetical protein
VDYYGTLKDFAGPGATIVAALSAVVVTAYFSSQQAKTAQGQLRLNLFDKRYAVYKDIKKSLLSFINAPNELETKLETGEWIAQLLLPFDEAALFFSPTTCAWLQIVRADCEALLAVVVIGREQDIVDWATRRRRFRLDQDFTGDEISEIISERRKELADSRPGIERTLWKHLEAMPERFQDDLSLGQLTSRLRRRHPGTELTKA